MGDKTGFVRPGHICCETPIYMENPPTDMHRSYSIGVATREGGGGMEGELEAP